jgi:neutral amino acid transport system ATP-binding protein
MIASQGSLIANPSEALLLASNVTKSFGGLRVIDRAAIAVAPGSITGLIGPNGAGKTTLFNLLSNSIRLDSGEVSFEGRLIQDLPAYQVVQRGLVRTFQVARVLSKLSVLENMLLAAQQNPGEQFWNVWLRPWQVRQTERHNVDKAWELLNSVGLAEKAHDYAGALSGGQRKLLEMARALMVNPKLVLLDEPAAGVNPTLINQICQHIVTWNQQGITFLIIEHNMDVIMSLCDRVWVMAEGRNLATGTPTEIQADERVLEAYLGQ